EDAVAHLLGEVEPPAVALELVDDAHRLLVVPVAAPALAQDLVERLLADVPEGRVPQVVAQADRLGEILVEGEGARHRARDAARLERVREPGAVVVALGRDEHLGLVLEPPERLRVHDAVAVALKRRAHVAVGLRPPPLCGIGAGSEVRQVLGLPASRPLLKRLRKAHGSHLTPQAVAPPSISCSRGRSNRYESHAASAKIGRPSAVRAMPSATTAPARYRGSCTESRSANTPTQIQLAFE